MMTRTPSMILSETRELTTGAHRAVVDALCPELRHIAGYHAGWWDVDGVPATPAGKAIRPAFALAAARAAGADPRSAVSAAIAVELTHDFSLLHDDVIDGDLTRRHQATAWTAFGTGQALLAGDALLAMAVGQLTDPQQVWVLTAAVNDLCSGQSADLAFEDSDDVDMARCLMMAEGKTGALLGAACQLGAMAGGARAASEAYRVFGRELGLAFQLVDDLLGIWGDPAVTGKPVGSDLVARKKSLPVVAALISRTPAGAELARYYARDTGIDIGHAADLVEQAGGRAWARAEAARRSASAMRALDAACPAPEGAADLRILASLITERDS